MHVLTAPLLANTAEENTGEICFTKTLGYNHIIIVTPVCALTQI